MGAQAGGESVRSELLLQRSEERERHSVQGRRVRWLSRLSAKRGETSVSVRLRIVVHVVRIQ